MNGKCKFLTKEFALGIEHELCKNSKMREINRCKDSDQPLSCMGEICNLAIIDEDSCELSAQNSLDN